MDKISQEVIQVTGPLALHPVLLVSHGMVAIFRSCVQLWILKGESHRIVVSAMAWDTEEDLRLDS